MFSLAIFSLMVSMAASLNTLDSQSNSLSELLRRLNDLEKRLQVQERINKEQEVVIKRLILENKKNQDVGMPEKDISLDTKMQNETRGLNEINIEKKIISSFKVHLSNSKLKSRIPDENYRPENCCQNSLLNFRNDKPKKRSIRGGVGFYAYLSQEESRPEIYSTIVFDNVITNIDGAYSRHTGLYFCQVDGVYTFSWTLYCSSNGFIFSEIVVNSNVVGAMYCNAQGSSDVRHSTGVVVVELSNANVVYIRTLPSIAGSLHSSSKYRSSFSGWKLS